VGDPSRFARFHSSDPGPDGAGRSPADIDRDRLLYCSAFPRLAGVTQAIDPAEGHIFHNRLTHTLEHEKGAQTLSSFDYTYDDVGNRTQAIDVLSSSTTIDYTYDPLYRLTEADYSTNEYFTYTYDEVGNRLTQETQAGTNEYTYDAADRLTEVDSVTYTWDDNGNLLDDGVREYSYDHANRLTQVEIGTDTYEFVYNGLGDRLWQIVNSAPTTYALDLNAGLTQVLGDGSSLFLYGLGRIGEEQSGGWQYHLGDALASVRQLTNAAGSVSLSRSYEPFGGPACQLRRRNIRLRLHRRVDRRHRPRPSQSSVLRPIHRAVLEPGSASGTADPSRVSASIRVCVSQPSQVRRS
jgi:YD repeat-containing protein